MKTVLITKINYGVICIARVNLPLGILDFTSFSQCKTFVLSCQFVSKIINIRDY